MTLPPYVRDKARALRIDRGLTIDEIAERLALSRSTIYHWVRDLPIERTERQSAAQRKGTAVMAARARARREAAYRQGVAEFERLSREPTFRDFVCMYIGEGYKRSRNRVALGNSDPAVVSLAARWITRFSSNKMTYSLQYHADQDLDLLREFWGSQLGIDPAGISVQRKSNSNELTGRTWRSRYGVLSVGCGDTLLRARLQAWIDGTKANWVSG